MKKVLNGKNIVVTRDRGGNAAFAEKIRAQGGQAVEFATIRIRPLTDTDVFGWAFSRIGEYDWVVFTSPNGVAVFHDYLKSSKNEWTVLGSGRIAAVGDKTGDKLRQLGGKADFVPSVFTTQALGKQLAARENLHGKSILLLRSGLASNQLADILAGADARIDEIPLYTVVPEKSDPGRLLQRIADGGIDWITFASPSSVRAFFEQIRPETVKGSAARIASIGPITSQCLEDFTIQVRAEASHHTIDGLLAAIIAQRGVTG